MQLPITSTVVLLSRQEMKLVVTMMDVLNEQSINQLKRVRNTICIDSGVCLCASVQLYNCYDAYNYRSSMLYSMYVHIYTQ